MNEFHDLNLEYLRVLSSLLSTKSVTRSARELGVTQSAVSHSLKKLRQSLGDEIVYREGNTLQLTAKSKAIQNPLKNWLESLNSILKIEDFVPKTSRTVFTVATTDIVEQLFAPQLIARLRNEAPEVRLRFIRWEYERIESLLAHSQIDLAVGVRSFDSSNIFQKSLYEEEFASMAREKHPIFNSKICLESFLAYPHVMTGPGDGRGAIDNYLDRINRSRNLLYTVNSFASAPALVESSDCILTAPKRFLGHIQARHKVRMFETPLTMKPFQVRVYWAKKYHSDQRNTWLRNLFYSVA